MAIHRPSLHLSVYYLVLCVWVLWALEVQLQFEGLRVLVLVCLFAPWLGIAGLLVTHITNQWHTIESWLS